MNAVAEIKHAETSVTIHELIASRWSPRAFSHRPVAHERVIALLEAARWAASSANEQPWRFIVISREDTEAFQRGLSTLNPGNQEWVQDAPVLVFTFAAKTYARNGAPNRHALHDVGLAMGNFSLQATALGLSVHQMGGFSQSAVRDAFHIPDDFEPVTAVALGYPGEPSQLPDYRQEQETAPRSRKPLEEIAFEDEWGKGITIV